MDRHRKVDNKRELERERKREREKAFEYIILRIENRMK